MYSVGSGKMCETWAKTKVVCYCAAIQIFSLRNLAFFLLLCRLFPDPLRPWFQNGEVGFCLPLPLHWSTNNPNHSSCHTALQLPASPKASCLSPLGPSFLYGCTAPSEPEQSIALASSLFSTGLMTCVHYFISFRYHKASWGHSVHSFWLLIIPHEGAYLIYSNQYHSSVHVM